MTLFQLILLIAAAVIFFLFFRQLFSGNYPQRGVDFEAKLPDNSSSSRLEAVKSLDASGSDEKRLARIKELLSIADESLEKGDNLEAKKALQSAMILDENNPEILRRLGVVYMNMNDYSDAREIYERLLQKDPNDDLAHGSLANALHKLGEDEAALLEHKEALRLDPDYAPHHYNYANTLYDLGLKEEALKEYKKALELDPDLKEAKEMVEELSR